MRLFRVTKDYLKEIQKISLFIPQQEEVLGTVLRINGYIYFLPILPNSYTGTTCIKCNYFINKQLCPTHIQGGINYENY